MKGRTVRRLQRLELTESPAWCTARSTEGLFVGTVGTVGTDGREGRLVALPPARQMTVHVQKVLIRSESRSTAAVQLCVAVQVVARLHLNLMQSYCSDTIVSHDDRDHLCYHVVGRAHLGPHHCPHPLRGRADFLRMESERVTKATSGRPGDEWQGDQSHPGVGGALSARAIAGVDFYFFV